MNDKKEASLMDQRSLVIIKPEAVKKKLIGKIISVYEENGLRILSTRFSLAIYVPNERPRQRRKDRLLQLLC